MPNPTLETIVDKARDKGGSPAISNWWPVAARGATEL